MIQDVMADADGEIVNYQALSAIGDGLKYFSASAEAWVVYLGAGACIVLLTYQIIRDSASWSAWCKQKVPNPSTTAKEAGCQTSGSELAGCVEETASS